MRMQTQTQFGAHEVMELHEVLTATIDTLNKFQLLRPHVQDPQLGQVLERQTQMMMQEYNNMVNTMHHQGAAQAVPTRAPQNFQPQYGLNNPMANFPNNSMRQMDDRDVASMMLCAHKASASMRMIAALECADPTLRRMIQLSAVNCAEHAYETWMYMNMRGYYQVPTLQDMTQQTMLNQYQPKQGYTRMASQNVNMFPNNA